MSRFEILPSRHPERPLLADHACLTPNSGNWRRITGTSAPDPKATWALPLEAEHWSLATLREKLINIGAKVVSHDPYVTYQLAEVAVPRNLFREILRRIDELRPRHAPA